MISDRIFGLVVLMVSLAFIASATQIQTSFLSDPVGPKAFPMLVGGIAGLCGLVMMIRPDPDPQWAKGRTLIALFVAIAVLVAYAYALKPFGFIIPTAIAAAVLSYQISPRAGPAALAGIGLSVGLFVLFKYALDLGLVAFPKSWFG
ncbi:tripartite tricarboxylate transporter TctB family protein [Leucothrix pacifica]|uniref:Tripartite tricarboxylate transporter TctB family protein n=1 Tax=Leucothrix pacifica TaxID=1247513 RepID=A0A317CBU1_9GAMM|nr:tripartite tricarboxylate transporter TctB family protein [Leucothrix pacifica]PWQ95581.1 tripartite tricarboxylate transporter TctB family protein [Leucothrix pacifica]